MRKEHTTQAQLADEPAQSPLQVDLVARGGGSTLLVDLSRVKVEQSHDLKVGYLMTVSYRRTAGAGRSNCNGRGMSSV